jgi:predicted nucleotidyltransferase
MKIDPCFVPLIGATVRTYREVLPDRVLSIRLMGSVARGDAIIGQSDIDFMGLVDTMPSATAPQTLAHHAERLQLAYPVVTEVDLDVTAIHDLGEFRRLVLSSDSLNLYGVDTLRQVQQTMDRAHLATLVTPDASALIQGYRTAVHDLTVGRDDGLLRQYSRVTGKDLLRCLRGIALVRGGTYEKSIEGIYAQVRILVPEHQPLAEKLFALYRTPVADKDPLLAVLAEADERLLLRHHRDDGATRADF